MASGFISPNKVGRTILKVVVGSQAHGLADEDSDFDYRGVYVLPTSQILKIGSKPETTIWLEGKEDQTAWEIGHYCHLALHCNPTVLETLTAPIAMVEKEGQELRDLFPYFLDTKRIKDAFLGYSTNQRKKMFDKEISQKGHRWEKFAIAYLRILWQGIRLFQTGQLPVKIDNNYIKSFLLGMKEGKITKGQVVDQALYYEAQLKKAAEVCHDKFHQDLDKINEFLLKIRKENW